MGVTVPLRPLPSLYYFDVSMLLWSLVLSAWSAMGSAAELFERVKYLYVVSL